MLIDLVFVLKWVKILLDACSIDAVYQGNWSMSIK